MKKDEKESLDNLILSVHNVLKKYKDKLDIKDSYDRIEKLKKKRNLK